MKTIKNMLVIVLICLLSSPAYAGRWVNWGTITTDIVNGITNGITSVVDFFTDNEQTKVTASGTAATKEVTCKDIDTLVVSGAGRLIITQDAMQSENLVIEADEAVLPHIETKIVGKKLTIQLRSNTSLQNVGDIVYRVRIKNLTQVTLSGAVFAECNSIKGETVSLSVSGASKVSGEITCEHLIIDASGASKIVLTGDATIQNLAINGSSKFDGRALHAKSIVVNASGAVSIYCNATDLLSGNISGASALYYATNPAHLSVKTSGVSSVQKL